MVYHNCPADFTGIEDRQDMGVLQAGGQLDLAQETVAPERRSQFRSQHLERDDAVVPKVVREVDHRHPALPSSRSTR